MKWNNFHYNGIFKGNTFISINILSQLIVTVTSSLRILYILDLKLTTSQYQASFRPDLMILNPTILISTHI